MNTRFAISLDSTRIAYDVNGSGPVILLLHGGGGSRREWHEAGYIQRLKDEFTVIAVDLRGHGESDKPTGPADYTTEKLGQDVLAVADACRVEHFILWGFSFGGNVSRYLAAHSKRVSRLIMLGNRMGTSLSDEFRQSILEFRARWQPVVEAAGAVFDPQSLPTKDQADLRELSFPGETLPAVLGWSSAMLDWGTVTPADLRCPALWVVGSENPNAMESYRECETELLGSNVQAHIFEGMTHEQEFENIEQILPVILAFVKKQE